MDTPQQAGKIMLVGFGPGDAAHMSYRARAAIAEADVVIGYSTYIKLVEDLLDGKTIVRKGMTEEIDRCLEAWEMAQQGRVVALISSGDVGVYGMAGPTYEVLLQQGWTPDSPISVEVIPGTTALNACASLVGAPLTHDFCSISLSDLLTPWPVIRRRIVAAGQADFVIGLYNPKSGRRTQQIVEAQRLLLQHRAASTPVAIVKSAYRRRQSIQMTTLDQLADCDIGMLTTVLIGNSSSYVQHGLLITPRGYANKYNKEGETRDGEQAGRSLSMGLDGWHAEVRHWLHQQQATWEAASQHFQAPLGEILTAVAADDGNNTDYRATRVAKHQLPAVIDALPEWGRLRAVIRSPGGAVSECLLQGDVWQQRDEWLNCVTEAFHVHIHWQKVDHGYFFQRNAQSTGVQFLDHCGNNVFRLLLTSQDDAVTAPCRTAFEQHWHSFHAKHGANHD